MLELLGCQLSLDLLGLLAILGSALDSTVEVVFVVSCLLQLLVLLQLLEGNVLVYLFHDEEVILFALRGREAGFVQTATDVVITCKLLLIAGLLAFGHAVSERFEDLCLELAL